MTNVSMYIGVPDRLRFVLGFIGQKLLPRHMRVLIAADGETEAAEVDNYLWTAVPGGFVPHARLEDHDVAETPVLIAAGAPADDFHADAMVSWQRETPPFFARFGCLVDIVPSQDKEAARARYRFYKSHGYQVNIHHLEKRQG